jgi:hypothetical protein
MSEKVFFGRGRHLPLLRCPNCNRLTDGATSVSDLPDVIPTPGAHTICAYCATWLIFKESIVSVSPLSLRLATRAEIESLHRNNPLARTMEQAARKIAGRPRRG